MRKFAVYYTGLSIFKVYRNKSISTNHAVPVNIIDLIKMNVGLNANLQESRIS